MRKEIASDGRHGVIMTENFPAVLKQIYDKSGLPTVITDKKLSPLWKNKLWKLDGDKLSKLIGTDMSEGLHRKIDGENVFSFNVMKLSEESGTYYIIELAGQEQLKNVLAVPEVKDYISYICARIRRSAGAVTVSADEIYSEIADGAVDLGQITDRLNVINGNIMTLLREVITPEQIYCLLDPESTEVTVCIADELKKYAADAAHVLGKGVKVTTEFQDNIFARLNRSAFETIVAEMAAECCRGELLPEEVTISSSRISPERAEIKVECVNKSGAPNSRSDIAEKNSGTGRKLFFDYFCGVLCSKYGAVFTEKELPGGRSFAMELDVIKDGSTAIAMTSAGFGVRSKRFCDMALVLSGISCEERYKFV